MVDRVGYGSKVSWGWNWGVKHIASFTYIRRGTLGSLKLVLDWTSSSVCSLWDAIVAYRLEFPLAFALNVGTNLADFGHFYDVERIQ